MKKKITTLGLLLVAFGGFVVNATASASPKQAPAKMHRVEHVVLNGHPTIAVGTSLNLVRQVFGDADEKFTPDLWLYHNFQATQDEIDRDGCSKLVIHFANDRVANIYLACPKARDVLAARIKRGDSELLALRTAPAKTTGPLVADNR